MGTIFTAPPITNEIPRAIFLGILSITKPTSNANPDADFLPTASSPWDLFSYLADVVTITDINITTGTIIDLDLDFYQEYDLLH